MLDQMRYIFTATGEELNANTGRDECLTEDKTDGLISSLEVQLSHLN